MEWAYVCSIAFMPVPSEAQFSLSYVDGSSVLVSVPS